MIAINPRWTRFLAVAFLACAVLIPATAPADASPQVSEIVVTKVTD